MGWWTVTSLVPSGKVASTCTVSIIAGIGKEFVTGETLDESLTEAVAELVAEAMAE